MCIHSLGLILYNCVLKNTFFFFSKKSLALLGIRPVYLVKKAFVMPPSDIDISTNSINFAQKIQAPLPSNLKPIKFFQILEPNSKSKTYKIHLTFIYSFF